ncbi:tRNA (adenine(22)-N(1))-methyltransferase [Clostridium fallax]|uniref:tRNA (Adenine22-N1)-methyltransferase n=1 Tax=Clostridium fallax TaxID=1533 RepID=A0A1M4YPK4_9CLOT|nr:class I SAM-dependent methyltransferase [Clostridium fallax]SHF07700.1 tRNA (adenine22-N1)-methyltransferase [Clostridium fallax]SQB07521.1 Bcl-2 family protein [Clostridium fallax]
MELSKRLKIIAGHVDKCKNIIDVGTDHGYIPIYLVKKGICESAVASDINKGPIEKAQFNVNFEGLKDKISCRLGGGLKTVEKDEVEAVIIAGMGGNLTRDILLDDIDKVKNYKFLILQPAQNPEVLREYLYNNNYDILAEDICFEEGKYYELFKVKYNDDNKRVFIENPLDFEISPILKENNHPLFKVFVQSKIEKYENILKYIKVDTLSAKERKEIIEKNINLLKEMI